MTGISFFFFAELSINGFLNHHLGRNYKETKAADKSKPKKRCYINSKDNEMCQEQCWAHYYKKKMYCSLLVTSLKSNIITLFQKNLLKYY